RTGFSRGDWGLETGDWRLEIGDWSAGILPALPQMSWRGRTEMNADFCRDGCCGRSPDRATCLHESGGHGQETGPSDSHPFIPAIRVSPASHAKSQTSD